MGAKGAFGIGGYLALNKRTAPFKNKKQKKTGEKKKAWENAQDPAASCHMG